eukprot:GHVR01162619.1.p2 GENE.GHVR01162619.1~~GHVR01162619.1.p2  ORF type:complete len:131 (-),score=12.09 GHVR01162619.1:368-760(-)
MPRRSEAPAANSYPPYGNPYWPDAMTKIPGELGGVQSLVQKKDAPKDVDPDQPIYSGHFPYRTNTAPAAGTYPPYGTPHWPNQYNPLDKPPAEIPPSKKVESLAQNPAMEMNWNPPTAESILNDRSVLVH